MRVPRPLPEKPPRRPKHPTIGNCYVNLGEVYLRGGELEEAEAWLGKAGDFWESNLRAGHVNHVILRYDLAELARRKGDGEGALGHCQRALELLAPGFDGADWRANPDPDSCRYDEALVEVWRQKAQALVLLNQDAPEEYGLGEALGLYGKIADLVERMRRGFRREASQQFLTGRSLPVFEEAVALAWEKGMAGEEVFGYAENSKAVLLHGAVQGREVKEYAGVPGELREREADLREELMAVNRKIDKAKKVEEGEGQMKYRELLRERLSLQARYEALLDSLEATCPDYFTLKYTRDLLSAQAIQAKLQDQDATLIAYFQGDAHLYGWAISPSRIQFRRLASRQEADALTDSLLLRTTSKRPLRDLPRTAFQTLLAPLLQDLPPCERLILVRDGRLEYLPFALLQNPAGDYLIQQYALSYAPSASLYFRSEASPQEKAGYLGYAMTFPGGVDISQPLRNKTLSALPHARAEVEAGARIFRGASRIDQSATEADFRSQASGHRILHLATHTLIDDRNPLYSRLLLQDSGDSDGALYTYELFGMDLDADLVVLSACNTGRGQLQRGEGMMSLSRGFAYAGCPSILMTHWTVSDRQNAALMEAFFENLADGMAKDRALQAAQLAYLAEADEITGHPWYWAAPALVGDAAPLEGMGGGFAWGWLVAGMTLLGALVFWWRKRSGE